MAIQKVLIANRGEIALRIHRACQDLGIKTVAVHSTADSDAMHVHMADESVCIGPAPSRDSYLNPSQILSAALISHADAIHPGYGFLSENAKFARIVQEHNLIFIGPKPEHIDVMGDKITAKETAKGLGIPLVPGSDGAVESAEDAHRVAEEIGYPVLIKATSGGGGKGMKVAYGPKELSEAYRLARSEAASNFGNDMVYMEKYLITPRHIEFQILADQYGNVVHLGERDCSLQRRHQKIFEEAPSPVIDAKTRAQMGELVCDAMRQLGYKGVGTIEFLYENGQFYFIEMNTRIQVEHPVTEAITGVDLVQEQIMVAAGERLKFKQADIQFHGHAIECRINAEHPETFMPCPGKIKNYHAPGGHGVRMDSAVYNGYIIPSHYDSLVGKLIVHGQTREKCLARLRRALGECVFDGIHTTLPLHYRLLLNSDIIRGQYDIHWLENYFRTQLEEAA